MSAAIMRDRVHCATMIHLGMEKISMYDLAPERKRNGQMLTLSERDGENMRIEETRRCYQRVLNCIMCSLN